MSSNGANADNARIHRERDEAPRCMARVYYGPNGEHGRRYYRCSKPARICEVRVDAWESGELLERHLHWCPAHRNALRPTPVGMAREPRVSVRRRFERIDRCTGPVPASVTSWQVDADMETAIVAGGYTPAQAEVIRGGYPTAALFSPLRRRDGA